MATPLWYVYLYCGSVFSILVITTAMFIKAGVAHRRGKRVK